MSSDLSNYFLALGSVFSTILVLLPTLTIIPIQKASDEWSHIIGYLYSRDKALISILIPIAISSIFCFVVGFPQIHNVLFSEYFTKFLRNNNAVILIIAIFLLSINFYWLYCLIQRVVDMLDPRTACKLLFGLAKKEINITNKNAIKFKRPWYLYFSRVLADESIEKQKEFYKSNKDIENILYLCKGLEEIGIKAKIKGEMYTIRASIETLIAIGTHYIKVRKNNFITYKLPPSSDAPEVINIAESDISHNLINPICQSINRILSDISNPTSYIEQLGDVLEEYRNLVKDDLVIACEVAEGCKDLVFTSPALGYMKKFIELITTQYDDVDNTLAMLSANILYHMSIFDIPKKVSMIPEYFCILHTLYKLKKVNILYIRSCIILHEVVLLIESNLKNDRLHKFNKSMILYIFNTPTKEMFTDLLITNYRYPFDTPKGWLIYKKYQEARIENIKITASIIKTSVRIISNEVGLQQTFTVILDRFIQTALDINDKASVDYLGTIKSSLDKGV